MTAHNKTKKQINESTDVPIIEKVKSKKARISAKKSKNNDIEVYDTASFLRYSSSIGLVVTDLQGNIISINKTVTDLLGYTSKELRKMNVAELYEDANDRKILLNKLHESSIVNNFETMLKHKNHTIITVLASIDHVKSDNSNILLTSFYDITQYKQRLNEHEKLESSYQTLFSNAPVGITVTDFKGDLLVSNNAIRQLLGYSNDELKIMNVRDFYYNREDRKQLIQLSERLDSVRDFETVFRHKSGKAVPVLLNTDKIIFDNRDNMLLTSIRDISVLKQIETDLTLERDFSNAILDVATSLIIVLDEKGKVTRFNHACEELTGYTFNEIEGKYFGDLSYIFPEITKEKIDDMLNGDFMETHENIWVSKNGNQHIVSWSGTILLTNNGQLANIIATGTDITERIVAENMLNEANKKLAIQIKELEVHTNEMNLLNDMGGKLQMCRTVKEACSISAHYIQKICPDSNGALYLINPSKTQAEAIEAWKETSYTQSIFEPTVCWAFRSGKSHVSDKSIISLRCEHIIGPENGQYLCVPLSVNGETIGILHLNQLVTLNDTNDQEKAEIRYDDHKMQIILSVAERIALTISNIQLKENLRQQSIRDVLTGLFNRRYMEETLERELRRAERENSTIGVIMFDIDHFKNFNDLEGHDAGDALLRELGNFLKNNMRGSDIVCRYGGEEFLAVLPGISCENAMIKANELRIGASSLLIYHLGKPLPKCTISLGVAMYPTHALTIDKLLKAVDKALYEAKNNGRDNVVMAVNNE